MSGLEGARCVGQGPLFESLELADRMEAAALCHVCPAIDACRALLENERATHRQFVGHGGGPTGTWAGEMVGGRRYTQRTRFVSWLERQCGVTV